MLLPNVETVDKVKMLTDELKLQGQQAQPCSDA